MEKTIPVFDDYPARIVALANGLSLAIYAIGSVIVGRLGWVAVVAYLLYVIGLEVRQLAAGCVHCAYYGRACFSGKGLVASWLFKRGDPSRFAREISWVSLVPDLLVVLLPLAAGVFLTIRRFDWGLIGLMGALLVLAFPGNGYVRGKHACCHCRQRELGCPAEKLFQAKDSKGP